MKVFRICPSPSPLAYRAFRKRHYLDEISFAEQIKILREQNVLLPGGWAAAMQDEGFEVFETLCSDWPLQTRWAYENSGREFNFEPDWELNILRAQVEAFRPQVIFIYAGAFLQVTRAWREAIRNACAGKIIITGFWGDELRPGNTYRDYFGDLDFVFTSSNVYENYFRAADIPAQTIGNAFDDSISYDRTAGKDNDFIFCGTTGYGFPDHVGRYEKLVSLMRTTPLRIWTQEPSMQSLIWKERFLNLLIRLPGPVLSVLGAAIPSRRVQKAIHIARQLAKDGLDASAAMRVFGHPHAHYFDKLRSIKALFPDRVEGPVIDTSDYYRLLSTARLVLNLHRDEEADIGNIRCFEVTGLGSCLVTDRGEELKEFFDVENDIVAFDSAEECASKVRNLLAHPDQLQRIAQSGQRTTLSRHTVKHRCQSIAARLKTLGRDSNASRD